MTALTSPPGPVRMVGDMEEVARFLGEMKFASDGGRPHTSGLSGSEKSFIPLLKITPVRLPLSNEPSLNKFELESKWLFRE